MSLTGDELNKQLPAIARKVLAELPVAGGFFKALEILAGIDEGVLQKRWQVSIEQKLNDFVDDIQQLRSAPGFIPRSTVSVSDEQLHLLRNVQQLVLDSHSREKRKAAARVLCYSTLAECDLSFDVAAQFLRDLSELENHHLVVLKNIKLQPTDSLVMTVPTSLQESFTPAIYEKTFRDLIKLGFISNSDGAFDGIDLKRTEYLKFFVDYLLQDIQS